MRIEINIGGQKAKHLELEEIIEKLPEPLRRGVEAFQTPFEQELVLCSSLTVASGLFTKVRGKYFQREALPNIFLLVVAPAASGKGAMMYGKKLASKVHKHFLDESVEKAKAFDLAVKEYNKAKKSKPDVPPPLRPPFKVVNIPANSSSAKILQFLSDNQEAAVPSIIMESEIDAITQNGMSEWPVISEMLRKAFHNEPISYSRKTGNEYYEIPNPALAVALSGTADQLTKLISSAENGLYSRFMVMESEPPPTWVDVRPCASCKDVGAVFEELAQETHEIWRHHNTHPFELLLQDDQWDRLNAFCAQWLHEVASTYGDGATSIVKRHGLMLFKLAMVLAAYRRYEWEDSSSKSYCLDDDFAVALSLVDRSLKASLRVYERLPSGPGAESHTSKEAVLEELPQGFNRKQAVEIGAQHSLSARSVDRYLKSLITNGRLRSVGHGLFEKL
ncbi:MAG: DUF3987 domain-containing protein [Sphingobacteriales bacterium]|nr:MAG: DUF3987 domain-containing protein [Sphingobacteriales bacterium]